MTTAWASPMSPRGMPTPDRYRVPWMKPGLKHTPCSGYDSAIACSALRFPWKYPGNTKPANQVAIVCIQCLGTVLSEKRTVLSKKRTVLSEKQHGEKTWAACAVRSRVLAEAWTLQQDLYITKLGRECSLYASAQARCL